MDAAQPTLDHDAIAALQRGDMRGLDILIQRHQTKAVRTAYLVVGDSAAAEDVVAEAFVRFYDTIGRFKSGQPFAPWFYRIVMNGAITWLRRNKATQPWLDELDTPSDAPAPVDLVELGQRRAQIIAAINTLQPEQRAVLVLRFYHDLDDKAIAQVLGVPHATVRWRMHRAKSLLRSRISADASLMGAWE